MRLDDRVLVISVGAAVALAGQVIVAQHRWMLVGAVVLAVGLVLLLAGFDPHPPAPSRTEPLPERGEGERERRMSRLPLSRALSRCRLQHAIARGRLPRSLGSWRWRWRYG